MQTILEGVRGRLTGCTRLSRNFTLSRQENHMPSPRILISELNAVGTTCIPYVWAILKSYWEHHGSDPDAFTWLDPIYNRSTLPEELKRHSNCPPDVVGLSSYTWNWDLQCDVAQ